MKNSVLFVLFLVSFLSCREDSLVTDIIVDEPKPIETFIYEFSVYGLVVDEDNEPIEMALVEANGENILTDENGYFEFVDLLASDKGLYVSAEKYGYVDGGNLIIPNNDNTQRTEIVLIKEESPNLIDNSTGGTFVLQNGSQVIIPANAFDVESEINVKAHFIPKGKENFSAVYPSGFIGVDKNSDTKYLNSIGALLVKFTDEQGNEVKLSEGVKVDLSLPVPEGIWPDQIALWALDEDTGYWIEETKADKVGGFYEASVSHFSWWSASDPTEFQDVCFSIKNNADELLSNMEVFIFSESSTYFSHGFTDETGAFCDKVPSGESLYISFISNCSLGFQEEKLIIDPNESSYEVVLEDLKDEVLFNGTITRCDGSTLVDGYLKLDFGYDSEIVQIINGTYSYLNYCGFDGNESMTILAVDKSDKSSAQVIVNKVGGETAYTTDITLCESLETYLTYKNITEGKELVLINCEALKNPTETVIVAASYDNPGENILLGIEGFTIGEFGTSFIGLAETALPETLTTTITNYQAVGGYVEGTFKGTTDSGDIIEGEFRANRTK